MHTCAIGKVSVCGAVGWSGAHSLIVVWGKARYFIRQYEQQRP